MRLLIFKNDTGGIAVFMIALIPLFVAMLAAVIWIGQITYARTRLQIAADRAAYVGASYLAHAMNEIAKANWRIYKAYRDLDSDYRSDTQQNSDAAKQRFERYESERNDQFAAIAEIAGNMRGEAVRIASNLLAANYPGAEGDIFASVSTGISNDVARERQQGNPYYSFVTGESFIDPDKVEGGDYEALKYLIKRENSKMSIGIIAHRNIRPLLLADFFGGSLDVGATAAAKAYGGSIGDFALKGRSSFEEAEVILNDEGSDGLYRQTLVPMWTIFREGEE